MFSNVVAKSVSSCGVYCVMCTAHNTNGVHMLVIIISKYLHFINLGNYELCETRFSACHTLLRVVNKNWSDFSTFLTYLDKIWHRKYR